MLSSQSVLPVVGVIVVGVKESGVLVLTSLGSGLSVKMKAQTIKLNNSEHQCRK